MSKAILMLPSMKVVIKALKWIGGSALVLCVIAVLSFSIYLETSFGKTMTQERQEWFFDWLDKKPALPENFIRTIEKYHPSYFDQSVWESAFWQLINGDRNDCRCREIYIYPGITDKSTPFYQFIVALELEEHYSQRRCYEIEMALTEFGGMDDGVRAAAKAFYEKELDELTEREILELNLMRERPSHYNPQYNQDNLDEVIIPLMNWQKKH